MLGITWVDSLSIDLLFATKLRGRQWICDFSETMLRACKCVQCYASWSCPLTLHAAILFQNTRESVTTMSL